jgi:hypothetical protein
MAVAADDHPSSVRPSPCPHRDEKSAAAENRAMQHVVILAHRRTPFESRQYFLREMAEVWRSQRLRVTVLREPSARIDADVAILHVDLTVVPQEHLDYVRQYPVAVNGRVADISKRRISANLVRRGDGYDGPVIVKTNSNCGGATEDLEERRGSRRRRIIRSVRMALPWTFRARLPTAQYRIFDSPRGVPRVAWLNRDLVVERFLPERRDGFFCLRTWVFMGDRETNSLSLSNHPVVKSENVVRREVVDEVPAELRRMRVDLGFDFGKFDYGIVDGRAVLYDANRTPTVGSFTREQFLPRIRVLAEGIRAFVHPLDARRTTPL